MVLCVGSIDIDDDATAKRRKRLAFRSWHRGTQEGDLLLGRFADRHLATMDAQALTEFEAVLEVPEPDLLSWYMGQAEVPEEQRSPTLSLILDFKVYD